jgi:hypothetical protein
MIVNTINRMLTGARDSPLWTGCRRQLLAQVVVKKIRYYAWYDPAVVPPPLPVQSVWKNTPRGWSTRS